MEMRNYMILKFKNGDNFLEVDTEFSMDMVDTVDKSNVVYESGDDTLELSLDELVGEVDEK